MLRTAIVILVLSLAACALADDLPETGTLAPPVPVLGRPPVEVGSIQVSLEARFISVQQTALDELGLSWPGPEFGTPSFDFYTANGAFVRTVEQEGSYGFNGSYDMAWCGNYLWGSWCQWVRAFDTLGNYYGYFWGPQDPNVGLATDGNWWYCSRPDQRLWRGQWDGMWGSTPTWEWITDPVPDLSGIAVDDVANCLWVTRTDGTVSQWGKDGGPILAQLPLLISYGTAKGCCMTSTAEHGYALAVLHSDQPGTGYDWVVFYDMSDTVVETETWGAIKAMFR